MRVNNVRVRRVVVSNLIEARRILAAPNTRLNSMPYANGAYQFVFYVPENMEVTEG